MDVITSTKNQIVKSLRALSEHKHRVQTGSFLIEGEKLIREALSAGLRIREVLATKEYAPFIEELSKAGARCHIATDAVISAVCETVTPQGICASFDIPDISWEEESPPRIIALDGVQDPGNLGTIWRTADAAGFGAIILGRGCADPYSPKVQRAAMGSGFRIGIGLTDNLPKKLKEMKSRGYTIISSSLQGENFYTMDNPGDKFILVIGNEANGISSAVLDESDLVGKLPMRGGAESLNAAVAAGIMMYELTKQMN